MKEIYWITRLDGLYNCFTAFCIVSAFVLIVMTIALINATFVEYDEDQSKMLKRWIIVPILGVFFNTVGLVFMPTTKEALTILGVGGTIEYVKDNETLKELPDKCVKALDLWVDSLIGEE